MPKPPRPIRGSRTGRPVMILLDILGKRWTLRILWELRDGRQTFRELQESCDDISPTTLNNRLRELREMDILDHGPGGYAYTSLGEELAHQMITLDLWAKKWAQSRA